MTIKPTTGIDKLVFGMKKTDVEAIFGKPSKTFKDDENNEVAEYHAQKIRLTFYADEDFRLGYLVSIAAELELFGQKIIGEDVKKTSEFLVSKGIKTWEKSFEDGVETYFNEDNWLLLQSEFGIITKVEVGAIFNSKDEFEWKF